MKNVYADNVRRERRERIWEAVVGVLYSAALGFLAAIGFAGIVGIIF